jgi:hypothetical protein
MIQLIRYIDEIAVGSGVDVMYITFSRRQFKGEPEQWKVRSDIMAWCQKECIPLYRCAGISWQDGINSYQGQLHVDMPFNPQDERFKAVNGYLENPDGSPHFTGVTFRLLTLDKAEKSFKKYKEQEAYWLG